MDLKEFIKRALLDVVSGVEEANLKKDRFRLTSHVHANGESGQKVEFDISVMINETSEKDLNGGIKVATIVNLGGERKKSESNENVHKIKFEVFIKEN